MVRNVFLNTELLLNDGVKSLSEYDIQSFIFLYFAKHLRNTEHSVAREREDKVDCVLYDEGLPKAFYEVKTYFKENEWLTKGHFDKDIEKMSGLLGSHAGAAGYILIAGSRDKFKSEELAEFGFIANHLREDSRVCYPYSLPSGKQIRLRPSQKQHRGQSVLISWEVVC
jgi:hypothetical protein